MPNVRRGSSPPVKETAGNEKGFEKNEFSDNPLKDLDIESERNLLRQKWEFASVLNFLNVFEPVFGNELKLTAEEIEMGLIRPDTSLTKLHITLLKGIPPVSKNLSGSDAWIIVLCKKLAMWWPWVAEGEIPLLAAKGEEIARYKELNPTTRLLILKALCEIRADQDDIVSYINDALKNGTQLSCFRIEKIGGDGSGTSYWCDGNSVIGLRLYKEIKKVESKPRRKGKEFLNLPAFSLQWETIATNLEEFRAVADKLSSSKVALEVHVGKRIEADTIPVLEKIHKKKERALKKQQRKEKQILLDSYRDFYAVGTTRACRNRRPVTYTFDEYDRAINEALQISKRRKTDEEPRHKEKQNHQGRGKDSGSHASSETDMHSEGNSSKGHDSVVNDSDNDSLRDGGGSNDGNDGDSDYNEENDEDESNNVYKEDDNNENKNNAKLNSQKQKLKVRSPKYFGSRWSNRLAGMNGNPAAAANNNPVTKTRMRQRPTRNTAAESTVAYSEDGETSDNTITDESGDENQTSDADSEKHTSDADSEKHTSDADSDNHSSDAGPGEDVDS